MVCGRPKPPPDKAARRMLSITRRNNIVDKIQPWRTPFGSESPLRHHMPSWNRGSAAQRRVDRQDPLQDHWKTCDHLLVLSWCDIWKRNRYFCASFWFRWSDKRNNKFPFDMENAMLNFSEFFTISKLSESVQSLIFIGLLPWFRRQLNFVKPLQDVADDLSGGTMLINIPRQIIQNICHLIIWVVDVEFERSHLSKSVRSLSMVSDNASQSSISSCGDLSDISERHFCTTLCLGLSNTQA